MTVEELIKELEKYQKDKIVTLSLHWSYDGLCNNFEVIVDDEGYITLQSKG